MSDSNARARSDRPAVPLAFRAAHWLALVATPVFAGMAFWSGMQDAGHGQMATGTGLPHHASMALMYALMALFHAPCWLRLGLPLYHVSERPPR